MKHCVMCDDWTVGVCTVCDRPLCDRCAAVCDVDEGCDYCANKWADEDDHELWMTEDGCEDALDTEDLEEYDDDTQN